jgi:hypothetical protein
VGIGTSSPNITGFTGTVLTINGTGNYQGLEIGTSGTARMTIVSDGTNGYVSTRQANMSLIFETGAASERMRITSGGNVEIKSAGELRVYRSDNARYGTFYTDNLAVHIAASVDPIRFSTPERHEFYTAGTERMRITSGGNVAIGNTAANTELHIHSADTDTRIQITNSTTGTSTNTGLALAQQSDNAYIYNYQNGPMIFGTYGNERMRMTASGELWIAGTTDQGAYNLQCNGTGVWGAGAYVNGSDISLKENILDINKALDLVLNLKPKSFQYKKDYSKDRTIQTGFIAQDLLETLKDQVYVDGIVSKGKKHLNVAYQNLIPLLVKAIQEQQLEIENLKNK